MELVEQLKADAIDKGLCRLWQLKMKPGLSVEELIALYIKGIDFCINNDYPTLEFAREHFKGKCEPYNVFVDDEVTDLRNAKDVVLNGECKALLEYDGYSVSQVYARHQTKAAINVADYAVVTVDAFDDSDLVIATAGSNAQVFVNVYGGAKVECIGDGIKVKFTNKKTYKDD